MVYSNENEQLLNTFETNLTQETKNKSEAIKKEDIYLLF